jgi:hypothetical protein
MKIPKKYIPTSLNKKDQQTQKRFIQKSRKLYLSNKYLNRPFLKSFKSKKSSHIQKATTLYNVKSMKPNKTLGKKTKCSVDALKQIIRKGQGAYYSSGSRPNQTAQSWGYARLASSLTGGPASQVDYSILKKGCQSKSLALRMARKTKNMTR